MKTSTLQELNCVNSVLLKIENDGPMKYLGAAVCLIVGLTFLWTAYRLFSFHRQFVEVYLKCVKSNKNPGDRPMFEITLERGPAVVPLNHMRTEFLYEEGVTYCVYQHKKNHLLLTDATRNYGKMSSAIGAGIGGLIATLMGLLFFIAK